MRDEFAQSTEPGTSSKAELDAALRGPSNAAAPVQAGSGGAAPAPVAAAPSVKEAPRSTRKKEALASALVLQNRDRSTPASISQMQSIAARPDYTRLGFSRDFTNGAPVVAGGQISPDRLGRADTVAAGDRKIKVRYAVVEAGDVLASNDAGGTTNASYATDASRTRAIAGNGRIAGLQAAYQRKTGAGYRQALLDDDLHGVPRNTVQAMTAPVLVRVMSEADVTGDIGDVSNTAGTLALSAGEQARNDGRRVALDALEFTEDGAITPATMRRFVQGMPQAEQGALIDATGAPTRQAVDRLNGAIFAAAYDSDALVSLYTQATDPEARNIMSALAQAAPSMARLKGAGALDIRDLVTQAAEQAVNARRRGIKLADMAAQQDIDTDLAVARVLQLFAQNARTVAPVVEALRRAADFAHNEATKGGADMFGAVERADRAQVLEKLGDGDERRSTQGVGNQAGRRPAGQDAGGQAIATSGPADAASIEAGRPADQQPASGASPAPELTLAAQTADDLKAKTERETAATEAAQRKRALEQERLRREAEARDNKARADQTVDSFELGQDAGRQMSGMGDMFDAPATNKESLTVAPAAADVAPDPLATPEAFDGKTITQQVQVADTGKTATLRMDAGQALRDVNEREAALLKLKACMGR